MVNIGLFGAVTVGPLLGGAAATGDHWRWLMGGAAVLGFVAWALALADARLTGRRSTPTARPTNRLPAGGGAAARCPSSVSPSS